MDKCIESVLGQSFGDYEVIMVDDGSTDAGEEIILRYAEHDPRIIYKKTENGGPSRARNIGLDIATGSYVTFLDADDLISDEYVRSMISQIAPSDVCVCKKVRWNQRNGRSRVDGWKDFRGTKDELRRVLLNYQRSMRGATGRLYRMSVIRDNNVRFDEDMRYGEDMHFNYDFFRYNREAVFIDEPLYTYRIHNKESLTSMDHTFFLRQWKDQRMCIRETFGR